MKKKLLLVDDKSDFRQLLSIILQSNYEVRTAANGLEALVLLQSGFFPDVIVSDLTMPKVDGATLLNQLKSSDIFKYIPVVILSSVDASTQKVKMLKSGAADFMEKPFNPEELQVRIDRLFDRHA